MDEAERVKRTAVAVVFGGVSAALQAHDEDKASMVVRELWPAMLDLSGYEVAAECVLAMVGAFAISDEALDDLAIRAMTDAREGLDDHDPGPALDDDDTEPLPFAHDSLDDLATAIEEAGHEEPEPGPIPEPEPEPEPEPSIPTVDMAAIIAQANIDAGVTQQ